MSEVGEVLHQEVNEYLKEHNDTATWCGEVLDGSMRSEFVFTPIDGELYGEDGRAFGSVFDVGIVNAERAARKDPKLQFEVPRTYTERVERDLIYAMARGEGPNTMVVESDLPHALMNATKDVGGYNVKRKQTYQRVITRRPDGKIHIVSQSLDLSDRDGLEAIYAYFGVKPEPGELLGQRIHVDLSPEEQEVLSDKLKGIYDRKLAEKYGGEWHAGRQPVDYRNTYDFVLGQKDLLDTYVLHKLKHGESKPLLYNLAAAMCERFKATDKKGNFIPLSAIRANGNVFIEMQLAGEKAKSEGWVATGCGLTLDQDGKPVNPGDVDATEDQFKELGYGRGSEEEDDYGSRTFKCPRGHLNKREHNKLLVKCKTCNCDVGCGPKIVSPATKPKGYEESDHIVKLLGKLSKESESDKSKFTLAA